MNLPQIQGYTRPDRPPKTIPNLRQNFKGANFTFVNGYFDRYRSTKYDV